MAFGNRFVGIEIGANSIRAVAVRKLRSGYRVVAAEKIERDPAGDRILEFPEGEGEAVFTPDSAQLLRRFSKGAKQIVVSASDVEILLRHLPIPRSAGENLQPLIRAVLASPTEEEVTFAYRRLSKAAPAPDHDLVLVAASRGLPLRRLVNGLKNCSVKVKGLAPHAEGLLFLARTAAAEIPPGTPMVSLDQPEGEGEGENPDRGTPTEGTGETFVLLDEGGPLLAIAPDSDLKAVTFALIEDGDLLFARRSQLTSMVSEGGRPADGVGVINEITEEANRTLDLARGTLKRVDLMPGDIRIFGRRRLCSELAASMTAKMGVPVRIVPAEVWGSVTVQPGVVFDPGDYAIALGLAMASAEGEPLVVPPATLRLEKLGVHGRMRIYAAVVGVLFAVLTPWLRTIYYENKQDNNEKAAQRTLSNYISDESVILGRADVYEKVSAQYRELLASCEDDGGIGTLSAIFDHAPREMKFSTFKVSSSFESRERSVLPIPKKRIYLSGLIDTAQTVNTISLLKDFAQKLETEKIAEIGSARPQPQGEAEVAGRKFEKFDIEFVTPGSAVPPKEVKEDK